MSNPCTIPTSFRIPAGKACHRWVFVAGPRRGEIKPCSGKSITMQTWMMETGPDSGQGFSKEMFKDDEAMEQTILMIRSRELDWIQESVEHLRELCKA